MGDYTIDKRRRPRVEARIESTDPHYSWRNFEPPSGIQVTIARDGLHLFGWYDSMVGIEGYTIPWEEFDELREWVTRRLSARPGR